MRVDCKMAPVPFLPCPKVGEGVDFTHVKNLSKHYGVSPTACLLKHLADAVEGLSLNKKLSTDRKSMRTFAG